VFDAPSQMEPMLPSPVSEELEELALDVARRSAALGGSLRQEIRRPVVRMLRQMNSYYSNLIEGHFTHPLDIERALKKDYAAEPAKRLLQLESVAHVQVQELIEGRLEAEPELDICEPAFLGWIHKEFYERMPETLRLVSGPDGETAIIEPGALRKREVNVGEHIPPTSESVPRFLARFQDAYSPARLRTLNRIVAAAASHHRLAWIHPFLDGNGRVTRLFTHAYLIRAEVDGHRLWTVSRGLGRRRSEYIAALVQGDSPRRGDLDGRGNLSNEGLRRFCSFFLETALDQVTFMSELLDLAGLERRVVRYAERRAGEGRLRSEAGLLLRDVLVRGEVGRGEAGRITGLGERLARQIVSQLTADGLLESETPKSALRLGFPAEVVPYYFPRLYPPSVEVSFEAQPRAEDHGKG
jgi:Fic family protein